MSDNAAVGTTLGITQTVSLFTVLMPPVTDINRHRPDDDHPFTSDVRQAELIAGGLSLTVGVVLSRVENSWTPFTVTAFLVAALIFAYEYTLRKPGHAPNLVSINTTEGKTAP